MKQEIFIAILKFTNKLGLFKWVIIFNRLIFIFMCILQNNSIGLTIYLFCQCINKVIGVEYGDQGQWYIADNHVIKENDTHSRQNTLVWNNQHDIITDFFMRVLCILQKFPCDLELWSMSPAYASSQKQWVYL